MRRLINVRNRLATAIVSAGAITAFCTPAALFAADAHPEWNTVQTFCTECHNDEDWAGSIAMNLLSPDNVPGDAETWEKAIRKLRGGQMPPPGAERPPTEDLDKLAAWLASTIDEAAAANPPAGRVALHRLNRREYGNAIRDLLGMNVNAEQLLPEDDRSDDGYDNNAAELQVSPAFIDQYLNAARTIAHDAVGDRRPIPIMETYGNVADMIISLP
jgi:hypothetical protein